MTHHKVTHKNHAYFKGCRDIIETSVPGKSDHIVNGYLIKFQHRLSLSDGKPIEYSFKLGNEAINIITFYPKSYEEFIGVADIYYGDVAKAILEEINTIIENHNAFIKASEVSRSATYPHINKLFKESSQPIVTSEKPPVEQESTTRETIRIILKFDSASEKAYGINNIDIIKKQLVSIMGNPETNKNVVLVEDEDAADFQIYHYTNNSGIYVSIKHIPSTVEIARLVVSHPDTQLHISNVVQFIKAAMFSVNITKLP